MNFSRIINQSIPGLILLFFMITAHAGTPVLSFNLNDSPIINLGPSGTTTVSYTVTNHSKKPHQLALSSTTSGIVNSGGLCVMTGKTPTNPNPTCTLTLTINASALPANHLVWAPVLCEANPNGSPNANQCFEPCHEKLDITRTTTGGTTLSTSIPSPSIFTVSVNNTAKNAALTGNARQITFTNTGAFPATNLLVSTAGLPADSNITTVPTTCTGTLAPGATCTVTVTPGLDSTSDCKTGIVPTTGTITLSATNVTTPAVTNVAVLDYGCQYQGGYLYSVDDTTNNNLPGTCGAPPCAGSIGGKIVAPRNQASPYPDGIVWSSNGGTGNGVGGYDSMDTSNDVLPGIDETSISSAGSPTYTFPAGPTGQVFTLFFSNTYNNPNPFTSASFATCNGNSDGSCNTGNILTFYNRFITNNTEANGGVPLFNASDATTILSYYAGGRCSSYEVDSSGNSPCVTGTCYSNWYLPAICEMGPDSGDNICNTVNVEQNIIDNLPFLLGGSCATPAACIDGFFWSSTEYSVEPYRGAWQQNFSAGGSSFQGTGFKADQHGVRCSRLLTP